SWDWLPLLERRPLWDIVLIVLSVGGAVMSVTGVVIGWRRLGTKLGTPARGRSAPNGCAGTTDIARATAQAGQKDKSGEYNTNCV
ncbi:MAG: hypothetical protein KKH21_13970, partial [Gammaproteobacteria bacterium]|nr:hypothetical protein [Gammaproteobacteria bacterium]